MLESSSRVKPWRQAVTMAVANSFDGPIIDGPVSVKVTFLFPRPAGHFGKKGLKPSAPRHLLSRNAGDLDKLCRSTLDGLSAGAGGVLIRDDSQVVELIARKRYTTDDESPGALITVSIPL